MRQKRQHFVEAGNMVIIFAGYKPKHRGYDVLALNNHTKFKLDWVRIYWQMQLSV